MSMSQRHVLILDLTGQMIVSRSSWRRNFQSLCQAILLGFQLPMFPPRKCWGPVVCNAPAPAVGSVRPIISSNSKGSMLCAAQKKLWDKGQCPPTSCVKPPVSEEYVEEFSNKKFASETVKKFCWVKKMFLDWKCNRNKYPDLVPITADLENPVESGLTKAQLSYALVHFVSEVKKIDGSDYPPKTIYELVISVQMYLESKGIFWKLLDEKDSVFQKMRCTVDNVMKERAATGMGVAKQSLVCSLFLYFSVHH